MGFYIIMQARRERVNVKIVSLPPSQLFPIASTVLENNAAPEKTQLR